jgi:hypothetical protein
MSSAQNELNIEFMEYPRASKVSYPRDYYTLLQLNATPSRFSHLQQPRQCGLIQEMADIPT